MLRKLSWCVAVPLLILAVYAGAWQYLSEFDRHWVNSETGPVEYVGTLMFLAAAIVGFVLFFRSKDRAPTRWRVFFLAYALGALFFVGEEISWGQSIVRFASPQFFEDHSKQKETNLHNLFDDRGSRALRRVAEIGVPIVVIALPLVLAGFDKRAFTPGHWPFYILPTWEAAVSVIIANLCRPIREWQWLGMNDVDELAELYWGLACLIWIVVLYGRLLRQPAPAPPPDQAPPPR